MKTNFLKNFKFEIFGQSHSKSIGATLFNVPIGMKIDKQKINDLLIKRNPDTFFNTLRKDEANVNFIGVEDNIIIKSEIKFELINNDIKSSDYDDNLFRLNHADYVSYKRYKDEFSNKGGGPFSGRMTAVIVVIGEIARQILEFKGISYDLTSQILKVKDLEFKSILNYDTNYIEYNFDEKYMVLEENKKALEEVLLKAKENEDSLGGKVEVKISNLDLHLGNVFFESFESQLAHGIFSIPGIKGIDFGIGEDYYKKEGSKLLEDFKIVDNKIVPLTNISGGINGGITNAYQDIYFTCIIKPPMTISKEIPLLEIKDGKLNKVNKKFGSRHDSFIANKALYAIKAWVNIIILDFSLENDIII